MGYPPGYGLAPARSSIPKVMGILMIIFAGLGLLFSLAGMAAAAAQDVSRLTPVEVGRLKLFNLVSHLSGLAAGGLHLAAGTLAVVYHRAAPLWSTLYAGLALLRVIVVASLYYAWLAPIVTRGTSKAFSQGYGVGIVVGSVILAAWPVVVVALMNREAARTACSGRAHQSPLAPPHSGPPDYNPYGPNVYPTSRD